LEQGRHPVSVEQQLDVVEHTSFVVLDDIDGLDVSTEHRDGAGDLRQLTGSVGQRAPHHQFHRHRRMVISLRSTFRCPRGTATESLSAEDRPG
jgi:hypothetical protein